MALRKHGTLTASTVATVNLDGGGNVEVMARGTGDIFFTTNGQTPAVAGDDTYCVPSGGFVVVADEDGSSAATTVKMISSGAPSYSVGIV